MMIAVAVSCAKYSETCPHARLRRGKQDQLEPASCCVPQMPLGSGQPFFLPAWEGRLTGRCEHYSLSDQPADHWERRGIFLAVIRCAMIPHRPMRRDQSRVAQDLRWHGNANLWRKKQRRDWSGCTFHCRQITDAREIGRSMDRPLSQAPSNSAMQFSARSRNDPASCASLQVVLSK